MSALRIRSACELLSALILIFCYIWCIYPLHLYWPDAIFYSVVGIFLIYSRNRRRASWRQLGFRFDNFIASGRTLLVITLPMIVVLSLVWSIFLPIDPTFYQKGKFWLKFFSYPFWALVQQSIVLAFFFRRAREVFTSHNVAIFFSALIFSAFHLPNPPLMISCFIAGLFWSWAYNKEPNLFAIAISHGMLGVLCSSVLLMYTQVGPKADAFKWSRLKSTEVYFQIDTMNGQIVSSKNKIVIDSSFNDIVVVGWVLGIKNKVKKVLIEIDGRDYIATYDMKREDVARYYKSSDYLFSGFYSKVPIADLYIGTHSLQLKILLENNEAPHLPSEKISFRIK